MRFVAPISAGDLADRISILTIKMERIHDPLKVVLVRDELAALKTEWYNATESHPTLEALLTRLDKVNRRIWDLEDDARSGITERGSHDSALLLASITRTNDERARLKQQVNELLNSEIREVKSHGHG